MRDIRWLAVVLLLFSLPTFADAIRVQTFTVGADLNDKGEVTQIQADPAVAPPIVDVLANAIKQWRFVPVQQNGKAVPVHTFIVAELKAIPAGNNKFSLSIKYICQGAREQRTGPPGYDEEAIRRHAQGNVEVIGKLETDGRLVITDTLGQFGSSDKRLLVKSTENYFQSLRYTPETVDGKSVPAGFRAYVAYSLNASPTVSISPSSQIRGKDADNAVPLNGLEKKFLSKTGFDVGIAADRSWQSGLSSVLQPRMVDTVIMQP